MHVFFIFRWFGLDTIACVIAIQLFLGRFRNGVDGWLLAGLCCAVSMVYIVDRYRDLIVGHGCTERHLVYQNRLGWVLISLIGLGVGAFLYWLALDEGDQLVLLGCAGVCGVHVWLVRFGWYQWVKDWVVASVFAVVMMVGYFDLVAVGVLIGVYTVFNLTVHRLVENGFSRFDRILFLGLAFGVMGLLSTLWLLKRCKKLEIFCPVSVLRIVQAHIKHVKMKFSYELKLNGLKSEKSTRIFERF